MKHTGSIANKVDYGRKLIHAGVSGIRSSEGLASAGQPAARVFADSALHSLTLAAIGTCAGLAARRGKRVPRSMALGAIGFFAGFAWSTRKITSNLAQAALKEIHKVSDEHWLEMHPIDYA